MMIRWLLIACNLFALVGCASTAERRTENVILITTDGLRWQELFNGADETLLDKENGGVANVESTREKYWRDSADARRETLMPFVWNTFARDGQIFGNANKGSFAAVTNDKWFSYPGYNEILCGFADPSITSNDKIPNKNVTVLEWLHNKPQFKDKVAAFSNWDAMPFIINRQRCGFPVFGGWDKLREQKPTPKQELLNDLIENSNKAAPDESMDSLVYHAATEHLKKHKPRVLYVAFGQTDSLAHQGRYDLVLEAANHVDTYIRKLWQTTQKMDGYRGKTTFIISTDHGRGSGLKQWRGHGDKYPGSGNIWIMVMGPDTKPLGERTNCEAVHQNQIAATLAALLGEDYHAAVPQSGEPIRDVLPSYDQ